MAEVNKDQLAEYVLRLADNGLILGQRLAEWCGHGPILEQDIALTNTSLDFIGEARSYYQYASQLLNDGRDEDDFAMRRDVLDYKNLILVEQPNGDFALTVARQFIYDAYHNILLEHLVNSTDENIKAVALKSIKEARYHWDWSSDWVIRLGDGTDESKERITEAFETLWMHTEEPFDGDEIDEAMAASGVAPSPASLYDEWKKRVGSVMKEATLETPHAPFQMKGGKKGHHSEHLGYILATMQFLPRAYPDAKW